MPIQWRVWNRKWHRWASIIVAAPFLIVLLTGILLQLKKEVAWVQPPTQRGQGKVPQISLERILEVAKSVADAAINDWGDIDRLDVQPSKGIVKVLAKNRWEVQMDLQTAEVLQVAFRRSDLIEALHDGSWFHEQAKLWLFLPSALLVLGLWMTGIYLFWLPILARRKKQRGKPN